MLLWLVLVFLGSMFQLILADFFQFFGGMHTVVLLMSSNLLQSESLVYVVHRPAAGAIGVRLLM
jgi:hypothetical protein